MRDYFEIINTPTYMRRDEKVLLAYVAASLPAGSRIVEVGTYTGGSAYLLGLASKGRAQVVTIDKNVPEDLSLLEQVKAEFFHGNAASYKAARSDEPIDLLFIDGDHSFSGARLDYETLAPLVRPGGVVALHDFDIDHFGVKFFCDALLRAGCLEQWHVSQRLLVGRPVPGRPFPNVDQYVETLDLLMQVYDKSEYCKGWRKRDQALENFLYPFPSDLENVYFIKGAFRCRFLHWFYDIDISHFIEAREAEDTEATYYICSYETERTLETLRVHKRIPACQIRALNDMLISTHILRDLLDNQGQRALRVARNELEREIISQSFLRMSEARLYRLHELGFLHYFFYNLANWF